MNKIEELFTVFQTELEEEAKIKEEIYASVRGIDQSGRQLAMVLQQIHTTVNEENISDIVKQSRSILSTSICPQYEGLEKMLLERKVKPPFHQFHDLWRNATQKVAFLTSLILFLEDGTFAMFEDVAKEMKMKTTPSEGLCLELEEYLIGLLNLAEELARLSVTSVTNGNYQRALQISKFVAELSAGFRLLTFKNDFLRKKYDGLKYSVKKIEEVVYDLSIRGLVTLPSA